MRMRNKCWSARQQIARAQCFAPPMFVLASCIDMMSWSNHQNDSNPPSKKPRLEGTDGEAERSWRVRASRESHDCINPVRSCEEIYFKEALEKRDKSKELIKVSIGEDTIMSCVYQ